MTVLGIIPARGGSGTIPGKNVAQVAGRPLIAWTAAAALEAEVLDRLIVSTDSEEIAGIAEACGLEVPFLRPGQLAGSDTPGIQPILHAVRWLEEKEGYLPDYVMTLQPTSPLRTREDIEAAVRLALERGADSLVSVCPAVHHPYWTKRVDEDGRLWDFLSLERPYLRRQELPPAYALNGAIYMARREALLARESFYAETTYAYLMPAERSLDVDTPWDLRVADLALRDRIEDASH